MRREGEGKRANKQRRQEGREQMRRKECRENEEEQGPERRGYKDNREEKGRPNTYNLWKEERMKGALDEYREGVKKGIRVSVHFLSRA